jgi:hypothetical protein
MSLNPRHLRLLTIVVAAAIVATLAPSAEAQRAGRVQRTREAAGELARAAGRVAYKTISHPVPLYPGSGVRFNIAPSVKENDARTKIALGVLATDIRNDATAIGALASFSRRGNSYSPIFAAGNKRSVGGLLAGSDGHDGVAIGGLFASGTKTAVAGIGAGARVGAAYAGVVALGRTFGLGVVSARALTRDGKAYALGYADAQGDRFAIGGATDGKGDFAGPSVARGVRGIWRTLFRH